MGLTPSSAAPSDLPLAPQVFQQQAVHNAALRALRVFCDSLAAFLKRLLFLEFCLSRRQTPVRRTQSAGILAREATPGIQELAQEMKYAW